MKIFLYVHSLCVGGAEKLVTEYALKLRQMGLDVLVIVNSNANTYLERNLNDGGVRILPLYKNCGIKALDRILICFLFKFSFLRNRMSFYIKREKPDIIHIHTSVDQIPFDSFPSSRMIYTFHSNVDRYFEILGEKNKKRIRDLANDGMTFIAISQHIKNEIKSTFNTDKVEYIPNGVNIDAIRLNRNRNILHELGIGEDKFVVGHVGRFNQVKNHERLIYIFKCVRYKCENAVLVLVGGDEGRRINKIKKMIADEGLEDCVYFLGIRDDAMDIISAVDVLVIPSFSESFSLTAIEAQALGVRCIASDNLPDEVFCNRNCIKLSLGDEDDKWAEAILGDSEIDNGNKLDQFSMVKVVNKTVELYREVLMK